MTTPKGRGLPAHELLHAFDTTFVNFTLSVAIILIVSGMFFPQSLGVPGVTSWDKAIFGSALLLFVAKYLHEGSVRASRWQRVDYKCRSTKWIKCMNLGLYGARTATPLLIVLLVVVFVLDGVHRPAGESDGDPSARPGLAPLFTLLHVRIHGSPVSVLFVGICLFFAHVVLYWYPDQYLKWARNCAGMGSDRGGPVTQVLEKWLLIDRGVFVALMVVTTATEWVAVKMAVTDDNRVAWFLSYGILVVLSLCTLGPGVLYVLKCVPRARDRIKRISDLGNNVLIVCWVASAIVLAIALLNADVNIAERDGVVESAEWWLRVFMAIILAGQTAVDYVWNREFFFGGQ